MKKYYFLLLIAILASSCKKNKSDKTSSEYTIKGDTICITEYSPLSRKIETIAVGSEDYSQDFSTSGVVQAIPTKYAEIASHFAGRITKSFIHLGQYVRAGSPIFAISSPDFFETVKDYYQSFEEMRVAYKNFKREKDLVRNKVGVKKEAEEAELDYELKKKDYENAKAALSVYNISAKNIKLGRPLIVRSPITGEIIKNNIVIGQYLKDDADAVAEVADLSKVWMVANVKEKDIPLIQNLRNVYISLVAFPNKSFSGKIYHVSDMLDENTRSVQVIVECNNKNRMMKPGMYGYVKLSQKESQHIIIPASAVLQDEQSTYVYVVAGKNKYLKRNVRTESIPGNRIVVLSGLNVNEEIITGGTFYLNTLQ